MNNSVFWKNNGKCTDIKLVTSDARTNYLMLEPNDYTTKSFSEKFLGMKIRIKTNQKLTSQFIIVECVIFGIT